MEAGEIGSSAKIGSLRDENLFDEFEVVDDDARCGPQVDAEDVAVDAAKGSEGLVWLLVLGEKVHAADKRPGPRARYRAGRLLRQEPPHQQHYTQTEEREHVCSEYT